MSHPAWVCGLKQSMLPGGNGTLESHPAWVCGLKPNATLLSNPAGSHTLRGCVD